MSKEALGAYLASRGLYGQPGLRQPGGCPALWLNIAKRSLPRCAFNEPERMLHAFAVDADRLHQHEVEFHAGVCRVGVISTKFSGGCLSAPSA
jgi:hypothetical protein